jgi:nucleotide-binding universal stress UspA family protein
MSTTHAVAVTFEHILVPTDFSEVSLRALEYAQTLAKQGNSELLLTHVNPPIDLVTPPEAAWMDTLEAQSMGEQELEQRSPLCALKDTALELSPSPGRYPVSCFPLSSSTTWT